MDLHMSKYRDLIVGIFFLAVAVIYFALSFSIVEAGESQVGPKFIPQLIAGITFVLSVLLIIDSIGRLRQTPVSAAEARAEDEEETVYSDEQAEELLHDEEAKHDELEIRYTPLILTGVLLIAYVGLMETAGFVIATAAYLFLQFNVSAPKSRKGPRQQAYFLVGAVLVAVAVNYIFRGGFNVMLPQGFLG